MVFIAIRENGKCTCKTRIKETVIRKVNNGWKVKYVFDTLSETLHFETDDFSEILFPPTQMCPYEDMD